MRIAQNHVSRVAGGLVNLRSSTGPSSTAIETVDNGKSEGIRGGAVEAVWAARLYEEPP